MFKSISHKALSSVVLVLIVCYGFFKNFFLSLFSNLILSGFEMLKINPSDLHEMLEYFSKAEEKKDLFGWFIFYPTYYLLHITFISLLFFKQTKIRQYLIYGLSILIFLLVGFSALGKWLEITMLYKISYDAFQKLFGLPFILLFIEGGRILYKDIFEIKEDVKNNKSN
ncbi:MAG: hypothetical protein ACJA08_003488 [Cyclobacteriaceae bacterium]|jgi:hypothetical protein